MFLTLAITYISPLIKLIEWNEAFITNHLLLYLQKHKLPSFKKQKNRVNLFYLLLEWTAGVSPELFGHWNRPLCICLWDKSLGIVAAKSWHKLMLIVR
jgi:hypothetical protein